MCAKRLISLAVAALLLSTVQMASADLISTLNPDRGDGLSVITFTGGSGTWTVPAGVSSLEVLVIGGGGGGGTLGGGGGGGFYYTNAFAVTPGNNIPVTVGLGGLGASTGGAAGGNSIFDALIANGGMGGTSSTGGASGGNNQGGPGFAGGANQGGGGGAGQVGASNWFNQAKGGDGLASAIVGLSTYYAGGGSTGYGGIGGAFGGLGGGGSTVDGNPTADPNGIDGLGGGGAGGRDGQNMGFGGDGVVIVAFEPGALDEAIPEPATMALLGLAATGLGGYLRRRRTA